MSENLETIFYPGRVVKLKSGGPEMTVLYEYGGMVRCEWFSGQELRGHEFCFSSLELPATPSTKESDDE